METLLVHRDLLRTPLFDQIIDMLRVEKVNDCTNAEERLTVRFREARCSLHPAHVSGEDPCWASFRFLPDLQPLRGQVLAHRVW